MRIPFTFFSVFALLALPFVSEAGVPLADIKRDLNQDGYKEGQIIYSGKQIVRAYIDSDADGVADTVMHYKNGNRDSAVKDSDGDGYTDTWIWYYFTGVPWKIAEDGNRDGVADYWLYFKNGVAYKWELDRNYDGRADVQTLMGEGLKITRQLTDDDYDGFYSFTIKLCRSLSTND